MRSHGLNNQQFFKIRIGRIKEQHSPCCLGAVTSVLIRPIVILTWWYYGNIKKSNII